MMNKPTKVLFGTAALYCSVVTTMPVQAKPMTRINKPCYSTSGNILFVDMRLKVAHTEMATEEKMATMRIEAMGITDDQFDAVWQHGIPVALWGDDDCLD